MKRKFYLLALVCAVAGTSVISSCKDTDEDLYNDLKNQMSTSQANLDKLRSELNDKLKTIEAQLAEKLKEQGPKGDKGDKGDQGDQGANGNDGLSAYEIAVKNGFTGSEAEWLESLRGPKGDDAAIDAALEAIKVLEGKHDADIKEIKELITKLEGAILDITGVVIQNVYNSAFGYLSMPLDIQSNVLMAYYSKKTETQLFPVTENDNANGLTVDEMIAINADPVSFDLTESKIDLGKVYVSVNPTNKDFSGVTPLLVTTDGEEHGVALSALEKSNEKLTFGYTRADNGFYVTNATVADFGATEKLSLNVKSTAKKLKEAMDNKNNSKAIRAVYELFNNVCSRNAIQLTSANKQTVVSGYDIATILVNPLGFATLQTLEGSQPIEDVKKIFEPNTGKKPVDDIFSLLQDVIGNLHTYALPAIIAEDAEGAELMGADAASPIEVEGTVRLHAVSRCAEILVPFALKHLAVTKVTGAADNDQAMKDANGAIHMNCVIRHANDLKIDLANLVKGATYEITYSAMDYNGDAEAMRFYFKVK